MDISMGEPMNQFIGFVCVELLLTLFLKALKMCELYKDTFK